MKTYKGKALKKQPAKVIEAARASKATQFKVFDARTTAIAGPETLDPTGAMVELTRWLNNLDVRHPARRAAQRWFVRSFVIYTGPVIEAVDTGSDRIERFKTIDEAKAFLSAQ
jgi:hypothetical protein